VRINALGAAPSFTEMTFTRRRDLRAHVLVFDHLGSPKGLPIPLVISSIRNSLSVSVFSRAPLAVWSPSAPSRLANQPLYCSPRCRTLPATTTFSLSAIRTLGDNPFRKPTPVERTTHNKRMNLTVASVAALQTLTMHPAHRHQRKRRAGPRFRGRRARRLCAALCSQSSPRGGCSLPSRSSLIEHGNSISSVWVNGPVGGTGTRLLFSVPIVITVFRATPNATPWQRVLRNVVLTFQAIFLVLAVLCAGLYLIAFSSEVFGGVTRRNPSV
jgi:hypothetical protein